MGSVIIVSVVALWIILMIPAVAAPFLQDRSKNGANVASKPTTFPARSQSGQINEADTPSHRTAA